jgi:peptidoglycan/xylan/chitin deacetylase (PgdA/CDA1 family)
MGEAPKSDERPGEAACEPWATSWRVAAQGPRTPAQHAKRFVRNTILSARALVERRWPDRFLRCLFGHYVFDDQRPAFERLLRALGRHGTFVDTARLVAILEGRSSIDGPLFHLSFDDGFRNNALNAAPILKELRIPAAFFVPTSVIGAPPPEMRAFCRRIQYPAPIELMSWEDLGRLAEDGFEIGSHTRTHVRFSDATIDDARLEDELAGSKADLESRLGRPCIAISWPYGKRTDADARSLAIARRAGYRICFGAYRGSVVPGRTDPFSIPRHHIEAEWPLGHVLYFARGAMELAADTTAARNA